MKVITVKKWLVKAKASALKAESGSFAAEFTQICGVKGHDDQLGFMGEIVRETEKAVCFSTEITDAMGNDRDWDVWLPKSQIIATLEVKA